MPILPSMPAFRPPRLRLLLMLATATAALLATAPAAQAYQTLNVAGAKWPQGRITYFDATPYKPQVAAAIRAWNTSGARVRFVAVPRRTARLIIKVGSGASFCQRGTASLGMNPRNQVLLSLRTAGCAGRNPYTVTVLAAHELGHVLGLKHEDRRCAVMNSQAAGMRPGRCPGERWQWRCGILERDDVAGAVRMYGGTVRPRPRSNCDAYAGAPAPTLTSVSRNPETFTVDVPLTWNGNAAVPPFLLENRTPLVGTWLGFAWGPGDACPDHTADRLLVQLSPTASEAGHQHTARIQDPGPGRWCLSTFAIDAFSRPGAPATQVVEL